MSQKNCPPPNTASVRQKWNRRYADLAPDERNNPTRFVQSCLPKLPQQGRALDIAAGAGRHSLALARHGLRVDAVDISGQGLWLARQRALEAQLPPGQIQFIVANVERNWLPLAQYRVILVSFFLHRPLFALIKKRLRPGGWLIYETLLVDSDGQSGRQQPTRPEFLLQPGELREAFFDFDILLYDEGAHGNRATAQLLAQKPDNFEREESA